MPRVKAKDKLMTLIQDIQTELFALQDKQFRAFHTKLIPTVDPDCVIGVRTPALRKLAKKYSTHPEIGDFFKSTPHRYFDENQVHAFMISELKDFGQCIHEVNHFLPYVDNWATSDQLSPKVFKKHHSELFQHIQTWIQSNHTYTVRFGIGMLMQHYLDEDFDISYPEMLTHIHSDEYYINMMIAWYFATALAKRYEQVLPWLEHNRLDPWTHNKTIQKAIESYRITNTQKAYLKSLKR